jgi:D-3-phosphoglycerate dehydrogenase
MNKPLRIGISLAGFDLSGGLSALLINNGYSLVVPEQPLKNANDIANFFDKCEVIIAGSESLHQLVASSENLKLILRAGVGIDNFPPTLCESKGISWVLTESQVIDSVSNYVLGNILSITSGVHQNRIMTHPSWRNVMPKGICKSTIGIIGFGRIGSSLLNKLLQFPFAQFKIHDVSKIVFEEHYNFEQISRIEQVDLETCLSQSDIVSLHVPLNSSTKNLLNYSNLSLMRHDSWLINTSRGEIVDESSVYEILKHQRLGGAVLDVFLEEPYTGPLIHLKNAILTPHIGTYNLHTRIEMETFLVDKALEYISEFNNTSAAEIL